MSFLTNKIKEEGKNMDIKIRKATENDVEAIHRLNKNELGYGYPLEETKDKLVKLLNDEGNEILVAESDGTVVGYIHASNYDVLYAPHMKNILAVAVDNAYRRNGIGKLLIDEAEKWAKQTGACGIRLVSGSARVDAHEFYGSCGYGNDKQQLHFKKLF